MKNTSIRVGVVEAPLLRPFTTALRTTSTIRSLVLRLETDGGVGWGAASPTPAITGDSEELILADLVRALPALSGAVWSEPAEALERVSPATSSARAAVDIALHDAWARGQGRPLAQLLGGARASVVTDTTISVGSASAMAHEAADAVGRGFSVLKVKLGADAAGDLERLRAVRTVAPEAVLRVDANQGWTADQAIRLIGQFEDAGLGIELVEQPVGRHDLEGLARVTAAVDTPILADEAVFDAADARTLIERRAADLINVKLMKSGGVSGARAIVDLAEQAGVGCMVGAMMESTIGISAALALACGHAGVTMVDLDPPLLVAAEPVVGGVAIAGETLSALDAPGLGIDDVEGITWLG